MTACAVSKCRDLCTTRLAIVCEWITIQKQKALEICSKRISKSRNCLIQIWWNPRCLAFCLHIYGDILPFTACATVSSKGDNNLNIFLLKLFSQFKNLHTYEELASMSLCGLSQLFCKNNLSQLQVKNLNCRQLWESRVIITSRTRLAVFFQMQVMSAIFEVQACNRLTFFNLRFGLYHWRNQTS